ncbi:DUF2087 domain-containing protein [Thalassococcus sp. S3]|uniref:DUF2087 domain-containing protein n=1 Tax=Thalassococcus sp. S3 TaxID=2017482 RepID=UPI0010247553|nr:DUF2087 domain-containing protein [Thalassococcus sp. S3]QBF34216.1 hypothetical protein CFI11_23820 [Thalassococcus sp. S3]
MTKTPIPLHAEDLTVFTRALAKQLGPQRPSHLTLMNMIARAAGYQNVQHMRSASAAEMRMATRQDEPPADARLVERTLYQFDEGGRLRQWPAKRAVQNLALWGLWATLPANAVLKEKDINAHLAKEHLFQDAATLRRTMISCGLMSRKTDGTDYVRIEQKPTADAKAVIQVLSMRRRARLLKAPTRDA